MSEPVSYHLEDGIAALGMDDGKVNAMSIAMLESLHAAFDRAEADRAVVLLSGREGIFSDGFDLKVFPQGPGPTVKMLRLGATLAERILSFPFPVVTACPGHAYPAGAFLTGDQGSMEREWRDCLQREHGIGFDRLLAT